MLRSNRQPAIVDNRTAGRRQVAYNCAQVVAKLGYLLVAIAWILFQRAIEYLLQTGRDGIGPGNIDRNRFFM
jgi:hypothetical protein